MYDQFYGFSGRPFQLTPDARFYFESGTHRKAMSYLGYGLAHTVHGNALLAPRLFALFPRALKIFQNILRQHRPAY